MAQFNLKVKKLSQMFLYVSLLVSSLTLVRSQEDEQGFWGEYWGGWSHRYNKSGKEIKARFFVLYF